MRKLIVIAVVGLLLLGAGCGGTGRSFGPEATPRATPAQSGDGGEVYADTQVIEVHEAGGRFTIAENYFRYNPLGTDMIVAFRDVFAFYGAPQKIFLYNEDHLYLEVYTRNANDSHWIVRTGIHLDPYARIEEREEYQRAAGESFVPEHAPDTTYTMAAHTGDELLLYYREPLSEPKLLEGSSDLFGIERIRQTEHGVLTISMTRHMEKYLLSGDIKTFVDPAADADWKAAALEKIEEIERELLRITPDLADEQLAAALPQYLQMPWDEAGAARIPVSRLLLYEWDTVRFIDRQGKRWEIEIVDSEAARFSDMGKSMNKELSAYYKEHAGDAQGEWNELLGTPAVAYGGGEEGPFIVKSGDLTYLITIGEPDAEELWRERRRTPAMPPPAQDGVLELGLAGHEGGANEYTLDLHHPSAKYMLRYRKPDAAADTAVIAGIGQEKDELSLSLDLRGRWVWANLRFDSAKREIARAKEGESTTQEWDDGRTAEYLVVKKEEDSLLTRISTPDGEVFWEMISQGDGWHLRMGAGANEELTAGEAERMLQEYMLDCLEILPAKEVEGYQSLRLYFVKATAAFPMKQLLEYNTEQLVFDAEDAEGNAVRYYITARECDYVARRAFFEEYAGAAPSAEMEEKFGLPAMPLGEDGEEGRYLLQDWEWQYEVTVG